MIRGDGSIVDEAGTVVVHPLMTIEEVMAPHRAARLYAMGPGWEKVEGVEFMFGSRRWLAHVYFFERRARRVDLVSPEAEHDAPGQGRDEFYEACLRSWGTPAGAWGRARVVWDPHSRESSLLVEYAP